MKQFFKMLFASAFGFILGGILLLFILIGIGGIIAASAGSEEEVTVESNSVLHFNMNSIADRSSKSPFEEFDFMNFKSNKRLGLAEVLNNIEKAATDENIKGIYMDISGAGYGMANLTEVRNKLIEFKKSGKFIVSYADYFSQSGYFLASVADTIYLNPQGAIDFSGLHAELMFFKGAFEKLEIQPEIIRHGKFKSAVEPFMLDKMSDANREQTRSFLGSIWNEMLIGISEQRSISVEELQNAANTLAIRKADDALKLKFVDKLVYKSDVLEMIKGITESKSLKDLKLVTVAKYSNVKAKDSEYSKEQIAVIYALGEIVDGQGEKGQIGGESLAETIREARDNEKVKAIVLRVNSPGGSALASEVIWKEVFEAKKTKPVIVSMGNVAASGGYYIACVADTIVAEPTTITGSIGVFGLLFNAQKMFNNKLGLTFDTVSTAKYAGMGSATRPLSDFERNVLQESVEQVYDVFTSRVAEGRKMKQSDVDSVGQGRVWSGVTAKTIGLVDVLGGLEDAIEIAASKAKLEKYKITNYPKEKDPFEELMSGFSGDVKAKILEQELGEEAKYLKEFQNWKNRKGVQAIMPYQIEL